MDIAAIYKEGQTHKITTIAPKVERDCNNVTNI